MRRFSEAAAQFAERRRREDESPRLLVRVPTLKTLRLDVEERTGFSVLAVSKHVRHVVIANAPALFVLPCGDSNCKDGGCDMTHEMMRHLMQVEPTFSVVESCFGNVGTARCGRSITVTATATYAAAPLA